MGAGGPPSSSSSRMGVGIIFDQVAWQDFHWHACAVPLASGCSCLVQVPALMFSVLSHDVTQAHARFSKRGPFSNLAPCVAGRLQEVDQNGLNRCVIREIEPGSSASAEPAINVGDVIVTIGGKNCYGENLTA